MISTHPRQAAFFSAEAAPVFIVLCSTASIDGRS
jgi:hypothetical protein